MSQYLPGEAGKGGVLHLGQVCEGGRLHDEKYYSTSQDLLLNGLLLYLSLLLNKTWFKVVHLTSCF